MITVRKSRDRGRFNYGWLYTQHTFSFSDYQDPEHMGFHALRVINEDRVAPGQGFGTHPHRDMEILTYVLSGALEHKDSTGGGGVLVPGTVQRMSAGTGVTHSEFNHSSADPVHFLQIWIVPARRGIAPRYSDHFFSEESRTNQLRLIASSSGAGESLQIEQDASVYASILSAGQSVSHGLAAGRHAWLQVARGAVTVNGTSVRAGDGAAISSETALTITAAEPSEVLLFDLAE